MEVTYFPSDEQKKPKFPVDWMAVDEAIVATTDPSYLNFLVDPDRSLHYECAAAARQAIKLVTNVVSEIEDGYKAGNLSEGELHSAFYVKKSPYSLGILSTTVSVVNEQLRWRPITGGETVVKYIGFGTKSLMSETVTDYYRLFVRKYSRRRLGRNAPR